MQLSELPRANAPLIASDGTVTVTDELLRHLARDCPERQAGDISKGDQAILALYLSDMCGELLARRAADRGTELPRVAPTICADQRHAFLREIELAFEDGTDVDIDAVIDRNPVATLERRQHPTAPYRLSAYGITTRWHDLPWKAARHWSTIARRIS
ncbi:hypothetical protein [Cognatishimia sp. MH4019]|uniref:hypothetical protein n=1 Tax=Cognatishimia sp. MH4019 TaxID=2854030 RepID=UPI001CD3B626|nr:hypothetical protein [Cognatishimia sp. MH4019]